MDKREAERLRTRQQLNRSGVGTQPPTLVRDRLTVSHWPHKPNNEGPTPSPAIMRTELDLLEDLLETIISKSEQGGVIARITARSARDDVIKLVKRIVKERDDYKEMLEEEE